MRKNGKIFSAFLAVLLLLSAFGLTAFADSSGSTTLTATIPCTVTLQVGDHGKVTVDGTDYTGNASFQRDAGTAVTYTFDPNGLYSVDKVIYDGTEVTSELSGNTWTAPALTGNAALSVSFKLIGGGTPTYTVTFDANGHGTAPAAQTVLSGTTATKPADPTASGWTFGGWYKEAACTNAFDFSTPITGDITLYAKWTEKDDGGDEPPVPVTYTVTFDANGHGTAPASQTVESGKTATKPADPTASGWSFGGWYKEAACTNAFDFATPITSDITLFAKWTEDGGGGGGEHTHSYSSDWKSDSINHWHECSCGDKDDVAAHSFKWVIDKEATATKKGSKHEECKFCGYQRPAVEIPATGSTTKPTDPTESNPNTGALDDVPQTGDNSNMILWIVLLLASGLGVTGTVVYSKRKKYAK